MNDLYPINEPLLVYNQLTVSYLSKGIRTTVLDSFFLKLESGKFLAVVGPSGCGKSTLLNATAGFIMPDSGSIHLKGQLVSKPSLQIGFVSQSYVLFEWLTVEENIAFGLQSKKLPDKEIRQTVSSLLEVIGLTEQRGYYPSQLSGGMQQRVALARAIAPEPPVLLLDEPFSALDSETRIRMRELLLRLWTEHGTTILFVTHDVEEALILADRVLMLEKNGSPVSTMDVPFPRPRPHSIIHTEQFQSMAEKILFHYETFN
jgi:ABC-type nitrate/sulfonate/bicarbonate transport system ATPase subunit